MRSSQLPQGSVCMRRETLGRHLYRPGGSLLQLCGGARIDWPAIDSACP